MTPAPDSGLTEQEIIEIAVEATLRAVEPRLRSIEQSLKRLASGQTVEDAEAFVPCNHSGAPSVHHYQQGCRGTGCSAANSAYYAAWRKKNKVKKAAGVTRKTTPKTKTKPAAAKKAAPRKRTPAKTVTRKVRSAS